MRRLEESLPGGRTLLAVDVALAIWAIAWIVVAIVVARQLQGLGELSDTVVAVGSAAESSGAALGLLDSVPLLGETFGGALQAPADQIQEAGRRAQESGESSRQSIDLLTVLLGLTVALVPSLPVLAAYLPARVSRGREARAIESAGRRAGDDPLFREFLARRAAQNLSYRQLTKDSHEPWRELAEGRFDRLAEAELERLGIPARARG